jgi:hypothetical protein
MRFTLESVCSAGKLDAYVVTRVTEEILLHTYIDYLYITLHSIRSKSNIRLSCKIITMNQSPTRGAVRVFVVLFIYIDTHAMKYLINGNDAAISGCILADGQAQQVVARPPYRETQDVRR